MPDGFTKRGRFRSATMIRRVSKEANRPRGQPVRLETLSYKLRGDFLLLSSSPSEDHVPILAGQNVHHTFGVARDSCAAVWGWCTPYSRVGSQDRVLTLPHFNLHNWFASRLGAGCIS
jgi:hypothetical protein